MRWTFLARFPQTCVSDLSATRSALCESYFDLIRLYVLRNCCLKAVGVFEGPRPASLYRSFANDLSWPALPLDQKVLWAASAASPSPKAALRPSAMGRCRPEENFATLLPESNNLSPKANLLRRQAGIKNALQRLISTQGWAEQLDSCAIRKKAPPKVASALATA